MSGDTERQILVMLADIKGDLGQLKAQGAAQGEHLESVAKKCETTRADLQTHKDCEDAHGVGAARRAASFWLGIGSALVGVLSGAIGVWVWARHAIQAVISAAKHGG